LGRAQARDHVSLARPETALRVEDLSVSIGASPILDRVSFTAQAKQVTAVIGPNGAGKTTLLEALVGLRSITSGRVIVDGRSLRSFRERAARLAYLPDQSELPPELDVRALVAHAERCRCGPKSPSSVAELLAIGQLLPKPVGGLSQGEQKRLQLFCSLLLGRSIVVLDEPFSAFDPLQLRDIFAAVRAIRDHGAAVVVTIHQLVDAERIADRILLLADGKAVAFGSLEELRESAGDAELSLEGVFVSLLSRRVRAA
jgi:ABC-2 type transport system ATP-binding protein